MRKSPLFPIILLINIFHLTSPQCIYSPSLTISSIDQCSGQSVIDSSQTTFPSQCTSNLSLIVLSTSIGTRSSSTKVFSFDLQIQVINGKCSSATSDDVFTLQINDRGSIWTLLHFYYYTYPSGSSYIVEYNDNSNTDALVGADTSYDIGVNTEFELFVVTDLTYSAPQMKGYLAYREAILKSDIAISVYSSWQFDSSTKIFICSGSDGIPNYYCSITSFNYWFTNPSDISYYTGQLTPALLGSYLFGEGSGYKISDSARLGAAYLGASTASTSDTTNSPTWLYTEVGIEFTSTAQYVNIKPFQLVSSASEYDVGSFTISFWIRYTQNSGNGGNIFQYTNYDMSFTYFSLQIGDNGFLTGAINDQIATLVTPVSSTDWALVTATYALHPTGTTNFIMISVGGSSSTIVGVTPGTPSFAYNPNNQVRIGGPGSFLGSIYDFRIYSPGSSAIIKKASCSALSTNCLISLGKLTDNQCLTKPAATCHSSCKTCFDKTAQGCLSCYTDYHISNTQCVSDYPTTTTLSQTTTETIKGSQKAAQAATQAVNAVTAGSPSGVSAAIGGKIFFNIKFLNITYAENLEEALTSWGSSFISLGLTPDLPSSVTSKISNEELPYVFTKRDVPSSFLENFWESLGMVLLVAFIFLSIFTLECFVKKCNYKYLSHHLLFAVRAVLQNFLLAQLYSVFGDMLFYASLEFRAPNTHHKWSRLSLASGIILLVFMVVILLYHIHLLLKFQHLRKNKADDLAQFENKNKGSSVLFGEFKDISLARQSFLLFLTGRDLLFSFLLTLLFDYPLVECIVILILNLGMVAYLLLLPPFKSVFDATQQLFYEIVTLAVNVSVLVLAIMDRIDSPDSDDTRSHIGRFIIIINMIFNFGSLAFMLVKAFQTLYEIYKTYKAKKRVHKIDLKLQTLGRLSKDPNLSVDEIKNKEPKPLDQTNESFIMNKDSSRVFKPISAFENTNRLTLHLNQTEEENSLHKFPNALEVSSLYDNTNDNDEKVQALRTILEKNERARKLFQAKFKGSNSQKIPNENSPFDSSQK